MAQIEPSVRRVILGNRLREIREARGLGVEQVADMMGLSRAVAYRHEKGQSPVTLTEVKKYLKLYDVENTSVASHIIHMAVYEESGSWKQAPKKVITWSQGEIAELESMASKFLHFEPMIINGLIQGEEFIQALHEAGNGFRRNPDHDSTGLRIKRQSILFRKDRPQMTFITTESALQYHVGSVAVMKNQAMHMVNLISEHGIDIRIIPFSERFVPGFTRSAFLMEIGKENPVVVAYLEMILYGQLIDDEEKVSMIQNKFEGLMEAALTPSETKQLLENYYA